MPPTQTISWRMVNHKSKTLGLALNENFDSRWIGELPIVFEGLPKACTDYAQAAGYVWLPDDNLLFGGRFEHPELPNILYPV